MTSLLRKVRIFTLPLTHLYFFVSIFLSESRAVLLPPILRHLRFHISKRDDSLDKSLDILGNMLTHMQAQTPVSSESLEDESQCDSLSLSLSGFPPA